MAGLGVAILIGIGMGWATAETPVAHVLRQVVQHPQSGVTAAALVAPILLLLAVAYLATR